MDNIDLILILFMVISVLLSASSLIVIGLIVRSLNKGSAERGLLLDSKEFALLQQQYSFLLIKICNEHERLNAIEKFVSALIMSGNISDDDDEIMH